MRINVRVSGMEDIAEFISYPRTQIEAWNQNSRAEELLRSIDRDLRPGTREAWADQDTSREAIERLFQFRDAAALNLSKNDVLTLQIVLNDGPTVTYTVIMTRTENREPLFHWTACWESF